MEDILLSVKQYQALLKRLDEINQDVTSIKLKSGPDANYISNPELLTLLHISKRTSQRLRNSGRLPYVKIGKKLFFRTDIILNFFKMIPLSPDDEGHTLPVDTTNTEDSLQISCERCPLFVILNS